MPQVIGQMPTMIAVPDPPPDHPAPHDFFILTLVTTIICGILNLISLAFGIPAIVLAALVIYYIPWSRKGGPTMDCLPIPQFSLSFIPKT